MAAELIKLQKSVEELVEKVGEFSTSADLLQCLKIHHRITQIHPFRDGNGRSTRALLNWMMRLKGLPPIYFKVKEKDSYYMALKQADEHMEYKELLRVTIRAIFHTIMKETN